MGRRAGRLAPGVPSSGRPEFYPGGLHKPKGQLRDLLPLVPYAFPSTYGKTDLQHSPQLVGRRECWGFHAGDTLHEMG